MRNAVVVFWVGFYFVFPMGELLCSCLRSPARRSMGERADELPVHGAVEDVKLVERRIAGGLGAGFRTSDQQRVASSPVDVGAKCGRSAVIAGCLDPAIDIKLGRRPALEIGPTRIADGDVVLLAVGEIGRAIDPIRPEPQLQDGRARLARRVPLRPLDSQ